MRVPLSWIAEFVEIEGRDPEEIAEVLSLRSVEATLDTFGADIEGVRFGKVVEVKPLENLLLIKVDLGKHGILNVVTADRELKEGMLVPVAPAGSRVKGKEVSKRPFGSVVSEGIVLTFNDLGLDDAEGGVFKLEGGVEPGEDVGRVLGFGEPVLELDITPNRGDMLSVRGVARELSALLGLPKVNRNVPNFEETGKLEIEILDGDCRRYRGAVIEGLKIERSPLKVRRRLWQAGFRTINNVVDVTNYVMVQEGQPLHAFDLEKLSGGVRVRSAREGERIRTLEGKEVKLDSSILVIADSEKAVAVAGVVGGEETAVGPSTKNILLEAAYFEPRRVRRASKRLGIQTESSYRFERNVDIEWLRSAQDVAISMILELAGGKLVALKDLYPKRYEPKRIFLQAGKFNRYSGSDFEAEEVSRILSSLDIPHKINRCGVEVFVPPHRSFDMERDVDVIEEIMRVKGYESFPSEVIVLPSKAEVFKDPSWEVADYLRSMGLREVINISYEEGELYEKLSMEKPKVEITNPLVPSQRFMRSSLIPSLLRTALYNENHYNQDVAIFEIGRVFLEEEELRVGMLLKGKKRSYPEESWNPKDLSTLVQGVAKVLGKEVILEVSSEGFLHPHVQGRVLCGGEVVGVFGRLHPSLEKELELKGPVLVAEISLSRLGLEKEVPRYEEVSKFPPVIRDLALLVDKGVSVSKLLNEIRSHEMVEEAMVFDLYTGEKVGEGKKSVGVRLVLRSKEGSLSSEEAGSVVESLLRRLRERFGVEIR